VNHLNRTAVLIDLADQLRKQGSWCGETHIQKATYFLQELLNVPTGFDFMLYKHGPFSFDLRDVLMSLRADGFLRLVPQYQYGPSYAPTDQGVEFRDRYPKTLQKYQKKIAFVARHLGNKNVSELERIATALFVTLQSGHESVRDRANAIIELKPHIDFDSAKAAVIEVDEIIRSSSD
jgi:uncharacterized protein YwgA